MLLFPILWIEERGPGKWRGALEPRDVDRWWSSYERFIVHYADLAAAAGTEWLSIGSELGSTEQWRDRWYHLISRVRRRYRGRLLYSANWDHFEAVSFARRLDAVGVNGYFSLSGDREASEATLAAAWRRRATRLRSWAAAAGKPLVVTEVGYQSRDGAALEPWDYERGGDVDLEEQRRAYAAFVRAWTATGGLAGVFFWTWNGDGGPRDGDYTPRGKPAAAVLRRFFADRSRRPTLTE